MLVKVSTTELDEAIDECARDFRVSIHSLVLNLQSLNSQLLFVGSEKVSKHPYEIKVRGLASNREGVKHPKRLQYF